MIDRSTFDRALASLQAELGVFLSLKSRIYALPPIHQAALLDEQNALESRAMGLMGRASVIKEELARPVSILSMEALMAKGPALAKAGEVLKEMVPLVERIQRQKDAVAMAEGKAPAMKEQAGLPWGYVVLVGAAAAYYRWQKGRSRA